MSLHGKRKEIYKYEAPWTVYAMNWSVRPDKRFRLALGSFVEEYNNKVGSGGGRARLCGRRALGLGQSEGEEGVDPFHPSGSSGSPVPGTAPAVRVAGGSLPALLSALGALESRRMLPEVQGAGLDSGGFPACVRSCWEAEGRGWEVSGVLLLAAQPERSPALSSRPGVFSVWRKVQGQG